MPVNSYPSSINWPDADLGHEGSGSVLDALRLAVPLVVVPNPSLLDNHQEELAEEMARQGYAIHGHLESVLSLSSLCCADAVQETI